MVIGKYYWTSYVLRLSCEVIAQFPCKIPGQSPLSRFINICTILVLNREVKSALTVVPNKPALNLYLTLDLLIPKTPATL